MLILSCGAAGLVFGLVAAVPSRHASWGIKEHFGELWLPLAVTFVDLGAFGSISGYVVF